MRVLFTIFCLWTFMLAGCENLPAPAADSNLLTGGLQSTPGSPSPTETSQPDDLPAGPVHLVVWVPPFLNPEEDTPAAGLLKKRLQEYEKLHPELELETRPKAVDGPGGLLDFLGAANAAAPAALPDLVALPRDIEETAAVKGLLVSLDELNSMIDAPDWYPYARELAHLQKNIYGIPFAGDALVQVLPAGSTPESFTGWPGWLNTQQALLFPAGSAEALMTLALYQANGGLTLDDQGRPQITTAELSGVLEFYQKAIRTGSINGVKLVQLMDDPAVQEAFQAASGQSMVVWASHCLQQDHSELVFTHIPTPDGKPFSLATGWVWSIAARDEQKRHLAVSLAEFLTESHFLANWTVEAGFLPTRPSSLKLWADTGLADSTADILDAAVLIPPTDVLAVLQIPLQQAAIAVLQNQIEPLEAAQQASTSILMP